MKTYVFDLTLEKWKAWLAKNGEPEFRADQIFNWLYVKRVDSFEDMSNLSKGLRQKLVEQFSFVPLKQLLQHESTDGTVKFLYELEDKNAIETVVMKHDYGNSICVTTQVGCQIGCTFCDSTLGGLKRDLTAGEIVAQVVYAQKAMDEAGERISSIVVMGIGEPFQNYDALIDFLRIISHSKGINIGQRHITVSTSGIVPKIYQFTEDNTQVNLAISIHAPNYEIRSKLMPINRKYPFQELIAACQHYTAHTGRRITFEYALMGGVNDQPEHAEELARVLQRLPLCHVNLIPVNYVPERNFIRTAKKDIFEFGYFCFKALIIGVSTIKSPINFKSIIIIESTLLGIFFKTGCFSLNKK